MKALSLMQPWATLVMCRAKRIETRSWQTHYRGPLLIHASKTWTPQQSELCKSEPFASVLASLGLNDLNFFHRGVLLGTVELLDCYPIQGADPNNPNALHLGAELTAALYRSGEQHELAFGDYRPGRYGWLLANPQPLPAAIPHRGFPGLFTVDDALLNSHLPKLKDLRGLFQ